MRENGVTVEDGPIFSIYFREPNENLIELSNNL